LATHRKSSSASHAIRCRPPKIRKAGMMFPINNRNSHQHMNVFKMFKYFVLKCMIGCGDSYLVVCLFHFRLD
jgi:hypothetical protein